MSDIVVSYTLFYATHIQGTGGAIHLDSANSLTITHSIFSTLSSSSYGGAVYSNCITCLLSFSSFFSCYSNNIQQSQTDNIYGNAMYQIGSQTNLSYNEFHKCGPDSKSGDSSISCSSAVNCENQNATYNYGYGGSSGMSCRSFSLDSTVKYLNVIYAFDSTAIECCFNLFVSLSNFVNTQSLGWSIIYESTDYLMELNKCVFINSKSVFANNGRKYYITDCLSDYSFASLPKTNNLETIDLKIIIHHNLFPERTINHFRVRKYHITLLFIFINSC